MQYTIVQYEEVSSTNDLIKQAIGEGAPEGLVVTAASQTGGYGRRGNKWQSLPGGLYMSILLRPDKPIDELQSLSLLVAMAVRRALAEAVSNGVSEGDIIKVKWPNDVVVMRAGDKLSVDKRAAAKHTAAKHVVDKHVPDKHVAETAKKKFQKLCGISTEQRQGAVCVGIGININRPSEDPARSTEPAYSTDPARNTEPACSAESACSMGLAYSAEPACSAAVRSEKNTVTYLEDLTSTTPSIDEIRDSVLRHLNVIYTQWLQSGFASFKDEFLQHFALEGFKVRIDEAADRPINCEVLGITDAGHLLVLPEGASQTCEIASGTVTVISQ